MRRAALLAAAALLGACRAKEPEAAPPAGSPAAAVPIPVHVAAVERATLTEEITAPGRTAALVQQKVRAPFAGTLAELAVADGDRVRRGDRLGEIVSRDSEAALTGAREMERQARTDAERADAVRAVALAERGLVRAVIASPADGVVLAHAAARGDRVSEDQELLTLADATAVAFLVDVPQSELSRVRPGEAVSIQLAGRSGALAGSVHDVLPGANAADFTAPVRVDLRGLEGVPPIGLFGTARIRTAEHRNATVVPEAALLRDDVTGSTRIALIEDGRVRWRDVTPGVRSGGRVEIKVPPLEAGRSVVVSGQVGLPEGALVAAAP